MLLQKFKARLILAPLLGVCSFFLSGSAVASEAEEARVLYQKGNAAFRSGDDVMARHYYQQSLEKEDSFDTICNLGRTEARMKRTEEAYYHLALCVELYPADKELAEAREQFAQLNLQVKQELSEQQSGALDTAVQAELARRKEVAETRAPASGLEEEPAEVEEVAPERKSARIPVAVSLGALGVAGLVTGAVLHGVAGGTKKEAADLRDTLSAEGLNCSVSSDSRCSELQEKAEKKDTQANVGTGALVAGGAFAVGAVLTYVLWPDAEEQSGAASVRPRVLAAGAGGDWRFGVSGRF